MDLKPSPVRHRVLGAIKNTPERKCALSLINIGLAAIETRQVVQRSVGVKGDYLSFENVKISLENVNRLFLFGVGKAATSAARELTKILETRVSGGVIVGDSMPAGKDVKLSAHKSKVRYLAGGHPLPNIASLRGGTALAQTARGLTRRDLALVIVSGGGSAMAVWPREELTQGRRLYQSLTNKGATILELNTVRRHLSGLKGGGLAQLLYPARVIGLIFSDVPGNHFASVASGPTYRDPSTIADARKILRRFGATGFTLRETPKDKKYFARVKNIPMVSNRAALAAMAQHGRQLGFTPKIVTDHFLGPPEKLLAQMLRASRQYNLVLAGGEPSLALPPHPGQGGRNQYLTLLALPQLRPNQLFLSFGSDGRDNGPAAGAIADLLTRRKAARLRLDPADFLARFDAGAFFTRTRDLLVTGPTGANVSDLMLLLTFP